MLTSMPPAIRTFPLGRRVALSDWRATVVGPVSLNVPVVGS